MDELVTTLPERPARKAKEEADVKFQKEMTKNDYMAKRERAGDLTELLDELFEQAGRRAEAFDRAGQDRAARVEDAPPGSKEIGRRASRAARGVQLHRAARQRQRP